MYAPLQLSYDDLLARHSWRSDPKVPVLHKLCKLSDQLMLIASLDPLLLQWYLLYLRTKSPYSALISATSHTLHTLDDYYSLYLKEFPFTENLYFEQDRQVAVLLETLWFKSVLLMEKLLCALPVLQLVGPNLSPHSVTWKKHPVKPVVNGFSVLLQSVSKEYLFTLKLIRTHSGSSTLPPERPFNKKRKRKTGKTRKVKDFLDESKIKSLELPVIALEDNALRYHLAATLKTNDIIFKDNAVLDQFFACAHFELKVQKQKRQRRNSNLLSGKSRSFWASTKGEWDLDFSNWYHVYQWQQAVFHYSQMPQDLLQLILHYSELGFKFSQGSCHK